MTINHNIRRIEKYLKDDLMRVEQQSKDELSKSIEAFTKGSLSKHADDQATQAAIIAQQQELSTALNHKILINQEHITQVEAKLSQMLISFTQLQSKQIESEKSLNHSNNDDLIRVIGEMTDKN